MLKQLNKTIMKIEKLIEEYKSKVAFADKLIESCSSDIRKLSKLNLTTYEYHKQSYNMVRDRNSAELKRIYYIQFIIDLESINA